jgi:hypothetical protein
MTVIYRKINVQYNLNRAFWGRSESTEFRIWAALFVAAIYLRGDAPSSATLSDLLIGMRDLSYIDP